MEYKKTNLSKLINDEHIEDNIEVSGILRGIRVVPQPPAKMFELLIYYLNKNLVHPFGQKSPEEGYTVKAFLEDRNSLARLTFENINDDSISLLKTVHERQDEVIVRGDYNCVINSIKIKELEYIRRTKKERYILTKEGLKFESKS